MAFSYPNPRKNRICYSTNHFKLWKKYIKSLFVCSIFADYDECQSPDACQSDYVCNNTVGSYTCECPLGYVADSGPQNPLDPVCVGKSASRHGGYICGAMVYSFTETLCLSLMLQTRIAINLSCLSFCTVNNRNLG